MFSFRFKEYMKSAFVTLVASSILLVSPALAEDVIVHDTATGTTAVVGADGTTYMEDDQGNAAVVDKHGNTVVEDADGNVAVVDKHGNTYAEDADGNEIDVEGEE